MKDNLTAEYLRSCLQYNPATGEFAWLRSNHNQRAKGNIAGTTDPNGYRGIKIDGQTFKAHRLAWLHFYGVWPSSILDHINGVRTDNRIANLREVTTSQNGMNRRNQINNTSGVLGVKWSKWNRAWCAVITINRKVKHLGLFKHKQDAIAARLAAEREYFGEYLPDSRRAA